MDEEMETNETDTVIKEMDVYLSKTLMNNLYLFQYPVRPSKLTYDDAIYNAARIKPKNKKVELEILLNTKDANYSKTKGEQFAMNVDNNSQQKYYKSNLMDKQLLVSTNAAMGSMSKHYCIGVLKSDQLHLTPLQNLVQLKPSFEYFDIYEKKIKDVKEQNNETDHSTEDEDADADKTELVTIRFTKDNTKFNAAPQEVEQNWIRTDFINDKNDIIVKESRDSLFCKDETVIDVDSLNSDYSKLLLNFNTENSQEKQ